MVIARDANYPARHGDTLDLFDKRSKTTAAIRRQLQSGPAPERHSPLVDLVESRVTNEMFDAVVPDMCMSAIDLSSGVCADQNGAAYAQQRVSTAGISAIREYEL